MIYRFHDYTLEPAGRELRHGAQPLALEPKVFQVLLYLLEHRDRVVSKTELLEQCWPETFVSESALTRCVVRLRKAVQPTPTAPKVIKTLHRQGYRFVAEVTLLAPSPLSIPVDGGLPQPPLLFVPPPSGSLPASSASPSSAGAERRQLTVLCGDVVDAATLAGQLDPEALHEVMLRYHASCTEVMHRYGGQIAQYLGQGLLVYFGWPQAHEDDARRAVHAGLALVTAVQSLGHELDQEYDLRLAVHIGIHTGLVVVGDAAGGPAYGQLALGATPHQAAQIQVCAAPDTVVISDTTAHLVQGYFICTSLGEHTLLGTLESSALYHVLHPSGAQGRLDITSPQHRTPFVGREAERAVCQDHMARVQQGMGQVVLLRGEAGIGKSRLLQEVKTACVADGFTVIELQCSPYYQHTALHPVVEWLQLLLPCDGATPGPVRIARLEQCLKQTRLDLQEHLPLLASLLNLDLPEALYSPLQLTPQRQRQRTLETLVALVLAHAGPQPLLLLVEDLHWMDPTTLEWLGMMVDQGPTAPLLTLMTCRPTFTSPWGRRTHVTLLTLSRLAAPQVTQMAQWLGGDQLSAEQLQHIRTQTDGVPLFVEEVTKFVLAAHRLQGAPNGPTSARTISEVPIPATLQDALMARLDQLGPAKATAQLGATIGREFPYALLQAVTSLEADLLRHDLNELLAAELLYQRGVGAAAMYVFKHALIQEVAYQSLLKRTRQQYHRHIAQALETHFPETVAAQPELLAQHYTEAGLYDHAVPAWQQSGQHALTCSAYVEAINHVTTGLEILTRLADTDQRYQQEIELQLTLALALHASKGQAAPEVEQAYTRARELCGQINDTPQLFRVLLGLYRFYGGRMQRQISRELMEQLYSLAQQSKDPDLLLEAHMARGTLLLLLGELAGARSHLEQAITLYNPQEHRVHAFRYSIDPGVISISRASWVLWLLGYPDQALHRSQETLALARALSHLYSLANALCFAAMFHQFRREALVVQELAEATIRLATEQGMAQRMAVGTFLQGWAMVVQGRGEDGLVQMRQGLANHRATGTLLDLPWYLGVLADACQHTGRVEEGLEILAEAQIATDATDFYEAELYRLKGELLLAQSDNGLQLCEAEGSFQQALDVARHQQAKSLELRAAMSLGRLWQLQGKHSDAHELLAPIYNWFTEGFDTADLQEAKALLDRWA